MKLKPDFVCHEIENMLYLIPLGGQAFKGIARGNRTTACIIDLLQHDVTEKEIVDEMCARFAAPREKIAADVARILADLREMNALEE